MDARDEVLALDDFDLDTAQADVEAFLTRVEHLVAGRRGRNAPVSSIMRKNEELKAALKKATSK